jgi:hypothetical protein
LSQAVLLRKLLNAMLKTVVRVALNLLVVLQYALRVNTVISAQHPLNASFLHVCTNQTMNVGEKRKELSAE